MSLTYNKIYSEVPGARKFQKVEITLENPYVPGGYAIDAASLGLTQILHVIPVCTNSPIYNVYWDEDNKKFLIGINSTGAEAGAIDLHLIKVYLIVIGY